MTDKEKILFGAVVVAVFWLLWERLHRRSRPAARTPAPVPPVVETQDAPACNPDGGCA